MISKNKKRGQTGGLITGLIFGVASLVIAVIIALVIVSTLNDANLLDNGKVTSTITVSNETPSWVNSTNYSFSVANTSTTSYTIVNIWNVTSDLVPSGFYQVDQAAKLIFTNGTDFPGPNFTNVTYTYVYTIESDEQATADLLTANFTEGVDKVSDKVPTVLLVAAIVLILGVLAILVGVWQRMRMGGGSPL